MILRFVHKRERGQHKPEALRRAELTRATFRLTVSQLDALRPSARGGVGPLDIDMAEGGFLAAGLHNSSVAVYDVSRKIGAERRDPKAKSAPVAVFRGHSRSVEAVQWYPNDTGILTSSSFGGDVCVWDTNGGCVARVFDGFDVVYSHALSRTGQHGMIAIACKDPAVVLADMRSGSDSHILKGHTDSVVVVQWSPENPGLLASGGKDNRAMLWDVRQAKGPLVVLDQHNGTQATRSGDPGGTAHDGVVNGMVFTQDGTGLVTTGTDGQARLWDTASGRNKMVHFPGLSNTARRRVGICMSACSAVPLLFHPSGKDIHAYTLASGGRAFTLSAHFGRVHSCVAHPFEPALYSSSVDNEVLVWKPPDTSGLEAVQDEFQLPAHLQEDEWSDDDD